MLTQNKKEEIYRCVLKQYPDRGMYMKKRVGDWLSTNGYTPESLGFSSLEDMAASFPEAFSLHKDSNYIIINKWEAAMQSTTGHPADSFFGSKNLTLNDDIIEMSQQSLYALTKILGNGATVQDMKQIIYDRFDAAKAGDQLNFFAERYVFPVDYCADGYLVNGIITKNMNTHGKSLYFSFEKTNIFTGSAPQHHKPSQQKPTITPAEKEEIHNVLLSNFECGVPLHMAAISKVLADNGCDRARFGFAKMKDMLQQLDFLKLQNEVLGGVPQVMITILSTDPSEARTESIAPVAEAPVYSPAAKAEPKESYEVRRPAEKAEPSADKKLPEGRLDAFCTLPTKTMIILQSYLQEHGTTASIDDLRSELCDDFDTAASAKTYRFFQNKLIFPCRYLKTDGTPIELVMKPSTYEKPWFLSYVDYNCHDTTASSSSHPGKQLEQWAFLGSWQSFLNELAEKALKEDWDFENSPTANKQILIQYIKYTFYRLTCEDKICVSDDKSFAAFNTGLVDEHYNDIFACFVPNDSELAQWRFEGFSTAASKGLGKQLVSLFNPLPQPAKYFKDNKDLLFYLDKDLHPDFEHIIIDNCRRLPLKFLQNQFTDCAEAMQLINDIQESSGTKKHELYTQLSELISENYKLFNRIQNRIKDAIELARKQVRWNYKTAIPSYFPKRNTMSLMLPLCLTDEEHPDVALVVELTPSGNYQGQTILTMHQAYIDARLLCRPNSEWLTPSSGSADADDETDD